MTDYGVDEEAKALRRTRVETYRLSTRINEELDKRMSGFEYDSQKWEKGFCLVNPYSSYMQVWDIFLILGLIYAAVVTPVDAAFLEPLVYNALFFFNLIVDLIFFTDIIITFNLPYLNPATGLWVRKHSAIARNYLRSWFIIDFVSVVPFDWIITAIAGDDIDSHSLRALRLLKLLKIARILRGSRIWKRWRDRVGINLTRLHLALYFTAVVLIAHWIACFLGIIPYLEGSTLSDSENWLGNYLDSNLGLDPEEVPPGEIYLISWYWATTILTTIGFGDITPRTNLERAIVSFLMLLGSALQAFLVGVICTLIAELNEMATENRITLNNLNEFMTSYDFPNELKVRLRKYFNYLHSVRDSARYQSLIHRMSPHLQDEVNLRVNASWIREIRFVQVAPDHELAGFVSALSANLRIEVYAPFERVISVGDHINKLYIVSKGLIVLHLESDLLDRNAAEVTHGRLHLRLSLTEALREELVRGQSFGHELIYSGIHAIYNVSTLQFTELHVLTRAQLDSVLERFPDTSAAVDQLVERNRAVVSDAAHESHRVSQQRNNSV
ncbi:Potassium voltage-gated channel subfamily H member 6 [Hondaea fermentalgiana]|uniref:Potassium voltage-gated channel subfamily H member 6 n=1 Tax=Hondaea fermentalgiana TaxID=2315210 RepID=A0A2R5GR38_9STRA|nr:Potassium voltage-gated channel subfamily H member 6 [Hondaea fermentalgiana]|eukprot:GBG32779.1 Potassium voltage-gated channel subfamily H member 6 [Hondaea fermentalgiana]